MDKPMISFLKATVESVKQWGEDKRKQGYVPTIDLFVEETTEYINKFENKELEGEGQDMSMDNFN